MRFPVSLSRLLLISMLGIFLLSCATTRRYEAVLDGWVGRSVSDLETQWGKPTRVGTYASGHRLYEYRFTDRHEITEEKTRRREVAGARTACTTFFVISPRGIVEKWKWEGDDCVAK